jgi:hypothetical protein
MVDELPKLAVRIKVVSAILAGGAIGWGAILLLMFSPNLPGHFFSFQAM